LGLFKYEFPELGLREGALPVEHYPAQVFIQGNFPQFKCAENQSMSFIHFIQIQIEFLGCQFSGLVLKAVG